MAEGENKSDLKSSYQRVVYAIRGLEPLTSEPLQAQNSSEYKVAEDPDSTNKSEITEHATEGDDDPAKSEITEEMIRLTIRRQTAPAMWEKIGVKERSLKDEIRLDPERHGFIPCKETEKCKERPPTLKAKEHGEVKYRTGSKYIGEWNDLGMAGEGTYTMPHGVKYIGTMKNGMFHGKGKLIYPWGSCVEGVWEKGRLTERKYIFADGLTWHEKDWAYCKMPDRRFHVELLTGFRPAGMSHLTQEEPTREIPPYSYDTGEGFYNPRTKCLTDPKDGRILRVPTTEDEKWIMKHCRKGWDENVGFQPELYENLFQDKPEHDAGSEKSSESKLLLDESN